MMAALSLRKQVTSMRPYPDIFSEDFKITDEINMTSLVEERKGNGP